MAAKFELNRTEDGKEFYFVLKSSNGKVVATSETYKRRRGAINGIEAVCAAVMETTYGTEVRIDDRT